MRTEKIQQSNFLTKSNDESIFECNAVPKKVPVNQDKKVYECIFNTIDFESRYESI